VIGSHDGQMQGQQSPLTDPRHVPVAWTVNALNSDTRWSRSPSKTVFSSAEIVVLQGPVGS
jgi:hypothetical protein